MMHEVKCRKSATFRRHNPAPRNSALRAIDKAGSDCLKVLNKCGRRRILFMLSQYELVKNIELTTGVRIHGKNRRKM